MCQRVCLWVNYACRLCLCTGRTDHNTYEHINTHKQQTCTHTCKRTGTHARHAHVTHTALTNTQRHMRHQPQHHHLSAYLDLDVRSDHRHKAARVFACVSVYVSACVFCVPLCMCLCNCLSSQTFFATSQTICLSFFFRFVLRKVEILCLVKPQHPEKQEIRLNRFVKIVLVAQMQCSLTAEAKLCTVRCQNQNKKCAGHNFGNTE